MLAASVRLMFGANSSWSYGAPVLTACAHTDVHYDGSAKVVRCGGCSTTFETTAPQQCQIDDVVLIGALFKARRAGSVQDMARMLAAQFRIVPRGAQ